MIEKIQKIKEHFDELTERLADPNLVANNAEYKKVAKEHNNLQELMDKYAEYKKVEADMRGAEEVYNNETDPEMRELANTEVYECKNKLATLTEELKILLLPKDENDDKNVIMEFRAGAGGEESCLFAHSLMRMYRMFAETHHFKFEVLNIEETEMGGVKEAEVMIKGKNAYATFKFESGVHRVQRVPETESQGRVHTSTATVAVLPEMEDVEFEIDPKDIRMDIYRSSGAGGQHVNKTESAVRITHFPTGIVVACQDERSQVQNKEKAMQILKSKLYDYYKTQKESEYKANRNSQIGTGDRSERIRTYNYPQGRITDHRINFTSYNLEAFMDGDLDEMIQALTLADQQAKLAAGE